MSTLLEQIAARMAHNYNAHCGCFQCCQYEEALERAESDDVELGEEE